MSRFSPSGLFLAAALVGASFPASAQTGAAELRMDAGTFRYTDGQSLAEVYLSVGASSLRYVRSEEGTFVAALPIRVTVRPAATSAPAGAVEGPVYDETLDLRFSVADTSALESGQVFTEQIRTALVPGEYEVTAAIAAGSASASVQARADLRVPDYSPEQGPVISSLELTRRIVRATRNDEPFVKSGMIVQPYPDAFFGGALRRVTYYTEVYGLPDDMEEYTLLTYLSDSSRPTQLPGTEARTSRPVRPVDVVVGAVEVGELPTGEYTLHLAALNASNEALAEQTKRFYVINPNIAQPERNVAIADDEELFYQAMGEEELTLNIAHARVIASSADRERIASLETDDERRSFLLRFWQDRNSAALTGNARREFYERLASANQQFRFRGRPGYTTDRGRVYLTYGRPVNIDRQAFNADSAPFEVWIYDSIPGQGRSQFVFADRINSGDMELIHSDVVGEVSMPNWQQTIINR